MRLGRCRQPIVVVMMRRNQPGATEAKDHTCLWKQAADREHESSECDAHSSLHVHLQARPRSRRQRNLSADSYLPRAAAGETTPRMGAGPLALRAVDHLTHHGRTSLPLAGEARNLHGSTTAAFPTGSMFRLWIRRRARLHALGAGLGLREALLPTEGQAHGENAQNYAD